MLIILTPFHFLFTHEPFYYNEHRKNGVNDKLGEEKTFLVTENVINFFKGNEELLYFSEQEKSHMNDVKQLYLEGRVLYQYIVVLFFMLVLIMVLMSRLEKHDFPRVYLPKMLLLSGAISLVMIAIMFIIGLNFNFLFGIFHEIFF